MSFIFFGWDLSPDAMRSLLPFAEQAAANEWMDTQVKIELENLVSDIRARVQHAERRGE